MTLLCPNYPYALITEKAGYKFFWIIVNFQLGCRDIVCQPSPFPFSIRRQIHELAIDWIPKINYSIEGTCPKRRLINNYFAWDAFAYEHFPYSYSSKYVYYCSNNIIQIKVTRNIRWSCTFFKCEWYFYGKWLLKCQLRRTRWWAYVRNLISLAELLKWDGLKQIDDKQKTSLSPRENMKTNFS